MHMWAYVGVYVCVSVCEYLYFQVARYQLCQQHNMCVIEQLNCMPIVYLSHPAKTSLFTLTCSQCH